MHMRDNPHRGKPPPLPPMAPAHQKAAPPRPGGLPPQMARERIEAAFRKRRRRGWLTPALFAVWLLPALYYLLTPSSYTSKWTLILPVSNNSATVSLDQIGQTTTVQGQTFGSITLSPKVIYREIANSEQVRETAAQLLGISAGRLGFARIRLIDETSLMHFQISGSSAEDAQKRAQAMVVAFARQLDSLRKDEAEKRAESIRDNLKGYQANLDAARQRMLDFQQKTGLRSLNQFNETLSSAELIRRKLAEHRSTIEQLASNQLVLLSRTGLQPVEAAAALKLSANPSFVKLAATVAESQAIIHENRLLYGPNHPALTTAQFKSSGAMGEIERIARDLGVDRAVNLQSLVLSINASQQAEVMRTIVSNESTLAGRRREVAALEVELARLEEEIARMGGDAARLENLKKDHLVAEAVLTSAVARLDTSKADLYSSYPIVQMLAEPDLPAQRSQPQLVIALAAGLAGTLFVLLAWGAAWFRRSFDSRRPRKSSSTG